MELNSLMPWLLIVGGYLVCYYDVLYRVFGVRLGRKLAAQSSATVKAQPQAVYTPMLLPAVPNVQATIGHPVLSDAVSAAVKAAAVEAVNLHVNATRAEIASAAVSGASAAASDVKPK